MSRSSRREFLAMGGAALAGGLLLCDHAWDQIRPAPAVGRSSAAGGRAPAVGRVRVGSYVQLLGHPAQDPVPTAELTSLEADLGRRFDIIHYYFGWGTPFEHALGPNTPSREMMLSLKPDGPTFASVAGGSQDDYLDRFAAQAATYAHPVYLRVAWEMNGSWMDYSAASNGPDALGFIRSWQHLVTRFRLAGATNVKFVWCPNESDYPNVAGNHLENYWPGEHWVDILGFDGYNWSDQLPARGAGGWRTFDQICRSPYSRIAALSRTLPIWVCEVGTTEATPADPRGVTKGGWYRDMFASRAYPRLVNIVYFSQDDTTDTQRDWRIDSSPASIAGWRQGWNSAASKTHF